MKTAGRRYFNKRGEFGPITWQKKLTISICCGSIWHQRSLLAALLWIFFISYAFILIFYIWIIRLLSWDIVNFILALNVLYNSTNCLHSCLYNLKMVIFQHILTSRLLKVVANDAFSKRYINIFRWSFYLMLKSIFIHHSCWCHITYSTISSAKSETWIPFMARVTVIPNIIDRETEIYFAEKWPVIIS